MSRIWLTARFEARSHLGRRSFWLTTFVLPAALLVVVLLVQAFTGGTDGGFSPISGLGSETGPIGYVDASGLVRDTPGNLPAGLVHRYRSESEAHDALIRGEIDRYYVLAADYLATGGMTIVQKQYQPLRALVGNDLITYVVNVGITGDETLAALLLDPTPALTSEALAPAGAQAPGTAATAYLLPYLLMFILYLALAMTSGFMLQSVSKEKENRTAEMLLASLPPRQLMLGKIAGLSAVGLLQVAIWLAVFFGVLSGGRGLLGIDVSLGGQMAAQVVPWTIGYFLLGYLMYASVYATLGVLAPTLRDANHFVFAAIIPLVIPLLFNTTFGTAPNGAIATALSLVPFTAPIAMVARLGATSVPWWQSLAGLMLLGIFAYGFVLLAARLFKAENILSSRALTWARLRSGLWPGAATVPSNGRVRPGRTSATHGLPPVPRNAGSAGRAGQGGWGDRLRGAVGGSGRGPVSKERLYVSMVVTIVLVAFGAYEYVRGDETGIVVAAVGIVAGLMTYRRYRNR
jgi:ABC-2 type transport system permease protein